MNDSMIDKTEFYSRLKGKKTFLLLVLGVLTLGIYFSHFFKRISNIVNDYLDERQKIPMWIINTLLGASYLNVILIIPDYFFGDILVLDLLTSFSAELTFVLMCFITILLMMRINSICSFEKDSSNRLRLLPALFFDALYLNYKINSFNGSEHIQKSVHPLYYLLLLIETSIISTTLTFIVPQVAVRMEDFDKELSTLVKVVMSASNFLQKYLLIIIAVLIFFKFIFSKKFDLLYAPIVKGFSIVGIGLLIWFHLDLLWLSYLSRGVFESLWIFVNLQ